MAYLHCHNCDWEQGDFWDIDGYNPFRADIVQYYIDTLFKDKVFMDKEAFLDLGIEPDVETVEHGGKLIEEFWAKGKDIVAYELIRKARSILNMVVPTYKEWLEVKDTWSCPNCGSSKWDID